MTWRPSEPLSPMGYSTLRFALRAEDLVLPEDARMAVALLGSGVRSVQLLGDDPQNCLLDPDIPTWQTMDIRLSNLILSGQIEGMVFSGTVQGTFLLDAVELVAVAPPAPPITAVEEAGTTPPTTFNLAQNFPNPFNSATEISFALPAAAEVELDIYNLLGQASAGPAYSQRSEHRRKITAVRWDGRDDHNRALASGVYLYRLRSSDQVKTHKLLLIQ